MSPKRFHDILVIYLDEYRVYLQQVKSTGLTVSHCSIVNQFIEYVYNHHLVSSIEQITVSMANSKFQAYFKKRNKEIVMKETMKKILKGYFVFLDGKYGIRNEKLMKGLKR